MYYIYIYIFITYCGHFVSSMSLLLAFPIAFALFAPSWSSGPPPYLSLCSFGTTQSDCVAQLLQPLPVQVPRPEQERHDLREELWADFHLPDLISNSFAGLTFKPDWNLTQGNHIHMPDWKLSDKASPDWNLTRKSHQHGPSRTSSTSTSSTMKRASSSQSFGSSGGSPTPKKRVLTLGSIAAVTAESDETQSPKPTTQPGQTSYQRRTSTSTAASSTSQQLFFGWKQTEGDVTSTYMPKPKPINPSYTCEACNQGFANKAGYNGHCTSKAHMKKVGLIGTQATQLIRCILHYSK